MNCDIINNLMHVNRILLTYCLITIKLLQNPQESPNQRLLTGSSTKICVLDRKQSFPYFVYFSNQNAALVAQQQQELQRQVLALTSSPFGDSPLFRNSLLVS